MLNEKIKIKKNNIEMNELINMHVFYVREQAYQLSVVMREFTVPKNRLYTHIYIY